MAIKKHQFDIDFLTTSIARLVDDSKRRVVHAINNRIIGTYWEVGKLILHNEKKSKLDSKSSRKLIEELSKALTLKLGKGFNRSNLTYMRLLYLKYDAGVTLSHQLSWSHYIELLKVDDNLERNFYDINCICLISLCSKNELETSLTNLNHIK